MKTAVMEGAKKIGPSGIKASATALKGFLAKGRAIILERAKKFAIAAA